MEQDVLFEGTCRSRFALPGFLAFLVAGVVVGLTIEPWAGLVLAAAGLL